MKENKNSLLKRVLSVYAYFILPVIVVALSLMVILVFQDKRVSIPCENYTRKFLNKPAVVRDITGKIVTVHPTDLSGFRNIGGGIYEVYTEDKSSIFRVDYISFCKIIQSKYGYSSSCYLYGSKRKVKVF